MKRWLIMIGLVVAMVAIIGGIWGFNVSRKLAAYKAMGVPQQTVTAMRAELADWRQLVNAVGTVHAVRGADLSAELDGVIDAIHFESGSDIKAGTLLIEFRADDAVGKLDSLRANAELAALNYQRAIAQYDAQAISKAELDTQHATAKSAKAQVAEQQAIVDKKRIRAPFAGHLGIRNADPGQYVAAGTKLVTLQTLDPIYVDFFLPQQQLATLRNGQSVTAISDAFPEKNFSGKITAIDPQVDTETRNVKVRATLQNPKHQLLPGMYLNLQIEIGNPEQFVTLPLTAVAYNPYGATVFLTTKIDPKPADKSAKDSSTAAKPANELFAKEIFVTTGPTRGDQVAIVKGVAVGDQVVTSGQLKIKNGSPLNINNSVLPANDPNPHPSEE